MNVIGAAAVLLAVFATGARAQTPSVVDGRVEERRAAASLEREFAAILRETTGPAWIGYAVRGQGRSRGDGCWDWHNTGRVTPAPVKLEGSTVLFVLYRIENHAVGRIQIASADCPLDPGGLTLHWLTGVTATASLDWLETFTRGSTAPRIANGAVVAIALHGDGGVVDRLIALARNGRDRRLRSDALFWLGQRAGERAAGTISDVLEHDPDVQLKRQAVFALSLLPRGEGVPRLIELARNNRTPEVRRQAMFWLGQSQDPRALAFFEEVLKR